MAKTTLKEQRAESKPALKVLRAEAQRLGITAESAGCPIEELLHTARETDDPLGYLTIFSPTGDVASDAPPAEEDDAQESSEGVTMPQSEPPLSETPPAEEDDAQESSEGVAAPQNEPPLSETLSIVSITAPLANAELRECYISKHVELRLSRPQGLTLKRLHLALDAQGARLANGRRVIHLADAVKWLIEQLCNY